jgi:flagellar hook-associated protein 2
MSSAIGSSTLSSSTGLDVGATVDQLMQVERAPEQLWKIQQQAIAAQASALRDFNSRLETLETRSNTLKDITGAFGQVIVESSNEAVFSASGDSSSAVADHMVAVTQLATVSSLYSEQAFLSPTATFTPGDLKIAVGGGPVQTITFDLNHSTLSSAVEYINQNKFGISASLVNDAAGTRLVLVSKSSGLAGNLTVSAAPEGLGLKVGTAGQNAKLTIDGIPVESATNKVTGALQGVTLQLNGDVSGIPARLTVASDNAGAQQAIKNFVSAYNDIVTNINSEFQYNAVTKSSGTLAGNSTLRSLQSTLLSLGSFQLPGTATFKTLRSLGLEMQDNGTLKVNDATLATAFQDHAAEVENFFRNDSSTGFAQTLSAKLMSLTDSVSGSLVVDAKGLDDSYRSLGDQIEGFEVRMVVRQQQLTDEYTRIDIMLRQMTSLENQVTKQLESLK